MSRPIGSKNKPKQNLPKSEIALLLEQKRALPSGSQERIDLGRRIKQIKFDLDRSNGRGISEEQKDTTNPISVEIPSTKPLENEVLEPLYQPETIDNNCSHKDYCLKNNKSQQFTCYCPSYMLDNGCSFYKERTK